MFALDEFIILRIYSIIIDDTSTSLATYTNLNSILEYIQTPHQKKELLAPIKLC